MTIMTSNQILLVDKFEFNILTSKAQEQSSYE